MKNLTKAIDRQIQSAWRKLQRELTGESNRVLMVPEDYIPLQFIPAYVKFYKRMASAPTLESRLEFAAAHPVLEGAPADIHQVRCLDAIIGRLVRAFNRSSVRGSARALRQLKGHIADIAGPLARVTAYTMEGDVKTPVKYLEYPRTTGRPLRIRLG